MMANNISGKVLLKSFGVTEVDLVTLFEMSEEDANSVFSNDSEVQPTEEVAAQIKGLCTEMLEIVEQVRGEYTERVSMMGDNYMILSEEVFEDSNLPDGFKVYLRGLVVQVVLLAGKRLLMLSREDYEAEMESIARQAAEAKAASDIDDETYDAIQASLDNSDEGANVEGIAEEVNEVGSDVLDRELEELLRGDFDTKSEEEK